MKICVLGNQSRSIFLFWKVLMKQMRINGHEVICFTPFGDEKTDQQLRALGVEVVNYFLDRKGINPLRDCRTSLDFYKLFKKHKPDLLFVSTIKPVIYGCLAAKLVGIKHIYAVITGLGYAFEADSFLKKLINKLCVGLYRTALANIAGIFFQNKDDAALFQEQGILAHNAHVLFAKGTGVDTVHFAPKPLRESKDDFTFLLIGRLLIAKGFREYVEAAKQVKARYPHARFQILGPKEQGLGSISAEELATWQKEGNVDYLGQTDDVRPFIEQSHVVVLPSWREGVPTVIMEAMSIGRPCLVTDVPGCREVVVQGKNGLIVPVRNPKALAEAMISMIEQPQRLQAMAQESRAMAVAEFDAQKVAALMLSDMHIPTSNPPTEPRNDQ